MNPMMGPIRPPLALVLAGGRGKRLEPLTSRRSKPAVPFGARYRIVDFVLSNLVNSGIHSIFVLTQYKAQSLLEHLQRAWVGHMGRDVFISPVPAQMQIGQNWYLGNADAIYQNLNLVRDFRPSAVLVFGADHIYKMDVRRMLAFHQEKNARATVACIPVPAEEASQFGIMEVDGDGRIIGFEEKPQSPKEMPGLPGHCLASMGNYIFDPGLLIDVLSRDAGERESEHDFGRSILPEIFRSERVFAWDFHRNQVPGESENGARYWRDVGTIDAYYAANMDLRSVTPALNLYNWEWPIQSASFRDPPARFVTNSPGSHGTAIGSIIGSGSMIIGATVASSVVGRNVRVEPGASIEGSILLDNVVVGPDAIIRNAILDKNVVVAPGASLGGPEHILGPGEVFSDDNILVVPKAPETPESLARGY